MAEQKKKNCYGQDLESSKSLTAPPIPQTLVPVRKDNGLYALENLHPNHILPAYRPPNTPHPDVHCSYDPQAPHRIRAKRKNKKAD